MPSLIESAANNFAAAMIGNLGEPWTYTSGANSCIVNAAKDSFEFEGDSGTGTIIQWTGVIFTVIRDELRLAGALHVPQRGDTLVARDRYDTERTYQVNLPGAQVPFETDQTETIYRIFTKEI